MSDKIILTITPFFAGVLQRLLYNEIENQKKWIEDDKQNGFNSLTMRNEIIRDCETLREVLKNNDIEKYTK